MSDPKNCPNCGAPLPANAPEALCPKCLMENAAWSQTVPMPEDAASAPTIQDSSAPPVPSSLPEVPPVGADFGGYRIVRLLGRGGMGAVYEAEQVETGRRVALKVLSHKLDSDEARKRFIREGRLAASINHPNSVYVFGTEEIDGTPAIAMEIVPGGTLQEKVASDGPMSVPKAVDAILQIVAGLESAQAIGILHRDVKPSNCFVDEKGVAKIGDFGLSISTEGHGDSHVTMQGSLLGTPAFSSPEQLRGDELNARSDMYSVGATLFYLLTGHAPFEEGNMIKLLSRVLEEPAPNPRASRPDLPRNLARIIHRCLAKTPTDRFKSYADLRSALQPYSSESPTPATLALRIGAYVIDLIILGTAGYLLQALAWGSFSAMFDPSNIGEPKQLLLGAAAILVNLLYFGLLEGTRGASIGKKLLRLRLVRPNGNFAGVPRAFLRFGVMIAILGIPHWIFTFLLFLNPQMMSEETGWISSSGLGVSSILIWVVLFIAARRRNGYAGLHGLASGTRVVGVAARAKRPILVLADDPSSDPLEDADRIGPYHVIEPLGDSESGRWFLAYDTRLLRRVWVHDVATGTPEVPVDQRNLNRRGRLRWITGRRSDEENWDAFEAPAGKPLASLVAEGHPWSAVRFWLLDLAEEFAAAEADGTTPATLALDRVWITADGHAKLLDFPAPGTDPDPNPSAEPSSFLRAIGKAALGETAEPVPIHAQDILNPEGQGSPGTLLESLKTGLRRRARVSRRRRLAITLATSAFPLLCVLSTFSLITLQQRAQNNNPRLMELASLTLIIQMDKGEGQSEDLRRYIAHRYRDLVEDPEIWKKPETGFIIDLNRQRIAREAVADYPSVSPDELPSAEAAGESVLKDKPGAFPELPPIAFLVLIYMCLSFFAATPAILMSLITRRGLVLLIFGAVVVTKTGRRASRLRCFWRSIVAWSPLSFGGLLGSLLFPIVGAIATTAIVLGATLVVVVLSHLRRDRSLQDRLAGTWLVPK